MVSNERYIDFLKAVITCINNGDYFSVKELSNLELEKMAKKCKSAQIDINKIKIFNKINRNKEKPLKEWKSEDLEKIIIIYSKYIISKIKDADNIEQLKKEVITFEEFIKSI